MVFACAMIEGGTSIRSLTIASACSPAIGLTGSCSLAASAMKVLYQADNDLRKAIVRGAVRAGRSAREPRMNFRSAQAARLDGVPDPEVLAFAAGQA